MKHSIIFTTVITLALTGQLVTAGSISDPDFEKGAPLTAATMNRIKTAVNDNDENVSSNTIEITTNVLDIAANKNRSLNNETSTNSNDSRLDALEASATTTTYVSIGHTAFKEGGQQSSTNLGKCEFYTSRADYMQPTDVAGATGVNCYGTASVQLPHGKAISGLACTFYDNTTITSMNVHLTRTSLSTGAPVSVLKTPETTNSSVVQFSEDTEINTSGAGIVNNSLYAYNLFLNFTTNDFTSLQGNARLYGCNITIN